MRFLALLAAGLALLAPATATAQVRGHIDRCLLGVDPIRFGTFSGSEINTTGLVRLACFGSGNNNPYAVTLSEGASNSFLTRYMRHGLDTLNYNLYIEPTRHLIWGSGAGQTRLHSGQFDFRGGDPALAVMPIFARIEAQPAPPPGSYIDQILITVTF